MELNRIYNCDCLEGLRLIESNSIDCVVTSPPYNKSNGYDKFHYSEKGSHTWSKVKIDYDCFSDDMTTEEYERWQIEILNELLRVIKPCGSIFYNNKIRMFNHESFFPSFVFKSDAKLYQLIYWDRCCCCNVNNKILYPTTELVFWLTKGIPNVFKTNAKHQSEIWRINPDKKNNHPAPFPIELAQNCISLVTEKDGIVLDPFMGSGTTAIAAKSLERNYIGFELSPNYCSMANDRLVGTKRVGNVKQESLF